MSASRCLASATAFPCRRLHPNLQCFFFFSVFVFGGAWSVEELSLDSHERNASCCMAPGDGSVHSLVGRFCLSFCRKLWRRSLALSFIGTDYLEIISAHVLHLGRIPHSRMVCVSVLSLCQCIDVRASCDTSIQFLWSLMPDLVDVWMISAQGSQYLAQNGDVRLVEYCSLRFILPFLSQALGVVGHAIPTKFPSSSWSQVKYGQTNNYELGHGRATSHMYQRMLFTGGEASSWDSLREHVPYTHVWHRTREVGDG